MRRLLCDSRGHRSWTHTLAIPASILITLWFLSGGIDLQVGPVHIITATKSAAEYALAVGVWLAFLGQREWTEKKFPSQGAGVPSGV